MINKVLPLNKIANKFGLTKLYDAYIMTALRLVSTPTIHLENPNFPWEKDGIIISKEFISHKNFTSNYLVKKNGYTFWFKIGDGIELGCVSYFNESKRNELLKTISSLARTLGCHQVHIMTFEDAFLHSVFKEYNWSTGNNIFYKSLGKFSKFDQISLNYSDLNTF
jgi:hypothetical protein